MEEPSILDYLKSKLNPRRHPPVIIPRPEAIGFLEAPVSPEQRLIEDQVQISEHELALERVQVRYSWPWRSLLALVLAIAAQFLLEPAHRTMSTAIFLYGLATVFLILAILNKEWVIASLPDDTAQPVPLEFKRYYLLISLPLIVLAFLAFGGNRFTSLNLFIWFVTLALVLYALWLPDVNRNFKTRLNKLFSFLKNPKIDIHITPWFWLVLLVTGIALFFRYYWLNQVPGEMFSDHAEKLLDVSDILNGKYSIFFPRNTGREAIQMYLTATIATVLKTGLSFISLKLGTTLAGVLTLPYIYKLGKEIGNRWVAILAVFLTGIAYWPNVISRVGLRFPLYPLFVAPTLYYLIRGVRTSKRNDFILSGIALGLSLHGYTAARILPFVVVVAFGIYLIHKQSQGKRWQSTIAFFGLAFVSFVVFLPLFRYMVDNPAMFDYRVLTRLGTSEQQYPGPVVLIFLSNLWKAEIMFFWDNGSTWVHSVVGRPALDVVTAALYFLGSMQLLIRYIRQRHWLDLFLLVSVPLLMLPSILSLAFPIENPSLNRTGGAIIPVFLIAALSLEGLLRMLYNRANTRWGVVLPIVLGLALGGVSMAQNYDLVFNQYNNQFMASAWNSTEIGQVIHDFAHSIGSENSAYVIPFPYWVDTRLVGINAGYPVKDYALAQDQLSTTLPVKQAKLFIFKDEDTKSLDLLKQLYPQGVYWLFQSKIQGKNFYEFLVPPVQSDFPQQETQSTN
ncbi:MAG TPA: glycosyltransferase family 39 protein [Anaerolineaceae bacterium]|nr:glycosyltransferase family 39 protein [Anaerolineaceae bacterium]